MKAGATELAAGDVLAITHCSFCGVTPPLS